MNMATPLVSVILPTYNRAHLLQRSIKSVLDQSYRNLELIIVDDGSTDDTAEVVGRMSDDRIRYFQHRSKQRRSVRQEFRNPTVYRTLHGLSGQR